MKNIVLAISILLMATNCSSTKTTNHKVAPKDSPVAINGALSVKGNQIVNKNGDVVSFAGNSFFWSNEYWRGASFYNKHLVKWLRSDWNTEIVRCAMAVDYKVNDGYLNNPKPNLKNIETVIDAALDLGIYVIIDWHSHLAHENEKEAIAFFEKMAKKYGKYDNVIYEIFNEPLDISWSNDIKPYAEHVISAIRKIDPDNLIVVGTPKWSQDVDIASKDPIVGYSNIAYTLHFYAASHKQWLMDKAQKAMDNGIAIFVTEWGTVKANGDGKPDEESVDKWMKFMEENNISHCNWAINDKLEGASIIYIGSSHKGGWKDSELTESGKIAKKYIKNWKK